MGYKKNAIRGISWIGFLSITTKAIGFLEAVILARILAPSQFGAYGIALLALGLLEVLTESGVNIVLVQEKNVDRYISSAWIVSILRGILITTVLIIIAPLISDFFSSVEALALLYLISLVPLIRGFINPAVIKFQKELNFGRDFKYKLISLLVDTAVSIGVTSIIRNPTGIVLGLLAGVLTELLLSFILASPRPKFIFEKVYINTIFKRGKWITATSIFDYLFYNTDNIVVGRILGATSLGIYQLGYSLAVVPLSEVGKVFVHVTVPILIKISDNKKRLKSAYFKTILSITVITLPFTLIFAVFPYLAVWILGEKWISLVAVLPVLGALGFVKAVSLSSTSLFLSVKKQEYTTVITFVNILGLMISIVPLISSFGILGASYSALFGALCAAPFIIYFTYKTLSGVPKAKYD